MAWSLGARLLLAAVFAVAGAAKLVDVDGSRRAVEGFGVPAPFAGAAGRLLPVVELAAAVALLVPASAWWGAIAAAGLLAVFIVGMAVSLARGRAPDCHCFGQLHSSRVGPWTVVRNGALMAVAVLVIARGVAASELSPVGWVDHVARVELVLVCVAVVLVVVVAGLGWFCLELFRQNGRILSRLEAFEQRLAGIASPVPALAAQTAGNGNGRVGLPVGAVAPAFELAGIERELVSLARLCGDGRPVLLVFTDPGVVHARDCFRESPDGSTSLVTS